MTIKIISVGRFSLQEAQTLFGEYLKRIGRVLPVKHLPVKSVGQYLAKRKSNDFLIFLDEQGKRFSSIEFARWLEDKTVHSVKNLVFVIGPAGGFSKSERQQADFLFSLSPLTLQHELALVVLAEQIYRACTIWRGEPYHK